MSGRRRRSTSISASILKWKRNREHKMAAPGRGHFMLSVPLPFLALHGAGSEAGDDAALQEQDGDDQRNGHDDRGGGDLAESDLVLPVKERDGYRHRLRG